MRGGSSFPVLAPSPVWWHFILPGDSALGWLGTAHTHWPSSSARACPPGETLQWLRVCWGSWGCSGSRQLPCGKLSGWVSPHPGSHPAWLNNVIQTGARGPALGQAVRGSWHPSHNKRELNRCVLASTCSSLCFFVLPWVGRDHPFFAAFVEKALLHGWDWACLGRAGSLEGLALGEKFSSKFSVWLWAQGLQAAPLHAATLYSCMAGCQEDRTAGGTEPIFVPVQHVSLLLQFWCLFLHSSFLRTCPCPSSAAAQGLQRW